MSILLLAVFLIVLGATWLTWISIAATTLGLFAFIVGIVLLVDYGRPYLSKW